MLPEQIEDEVGGVIELIDKFYRVFGFEYHIELSTRPEKSMGSDEMWEKLLLHCIAYWLRRISYTINEGDGAFMAPRSIFTCRIPLEGPGSAEQSSLIFRCRKNLI